MVSNCYLIIISIESRRDLSALIVWSEDSSCEAVSRLMSIGGGSPMWPIRPKVVAAALARSRSIDTAGSTIGLGHGAGSTTGLGGHGAGSKMEGGQGCSLPP